MLNTVFNEDCLMGMSRIPEKSIDMILCDLPYGTTACKWDVIIPFEPLWKQYERVIKENGAIVLTASQPFTSALVMSNPKMFRYEWVWLKTFFTGFMSASKIPMKAHENILVFYKSQPTYNSQLLKRTEAELKRRVNIRTEKHLTDTYLGGHLSYCKERKDSFYKFANSVINAKAHKIHDRGLHPTQKPIALFEYLIKTYTNEGKTVLDNCMGSGTTAIACINTNRNYIGFEKEEKYYNIIQERIKKHTPQLKIAI
jgi:site-specific DNA-methyltransferase (adenine-specific)